MFVTVITCSDPPRRQNQVLDIRSNMLFGKAIYTCSEGYRAVSGVNVIECQQNEQWTIATLLCDGKKKVILNNNSHFIKNPVIYIIKRENKAGIIKKKREKRSGAVLTFLTLRIIIFLV